MLIIEGVNQTVVFSITKNKQLYSFRTFIGQGMEEAENILKQMLSTFRFFGVKIYEHIQ